MTKQTQSNMRGRWTICATHDQLYVEGPSTEPVPVVPCDDAAIERGAAELANLDSFEFYTMRELAEIVLRAAGETP